MTGEVQNKVVALVARKGAGKSTKLAEYLRRVDRVIVFDVMGEHGAWTKNRIESLARLDRFLRWSREQERFAASFVPAGELAEETEEVATRIYARGNLVFACEEVPLYTQAGYVPPLFGKLLRTGRHKGIDVVWTAQRAAEVPKTLTALTDLWVLGSQTEPRDLAALAERCGHEIADRVARSGQHDFFVWDAVRRAEVEDSPRLLRG